MPSIAKIEDKDIDQLERYLLKLSQTTRGYFGPHAFNNEALRAFFLDKSNQGFIAIENGKIIAYAIVKKGILDHERQRLAAYGLLLNTEKDATFAPSVADDWQGKGIGRQMFTYIVEVLSATPINRIVLWGGVQTANERAIKFYQNLGFQTLGHFEYHGWNADMIFHLPNR